jgi:PRTRC genetic system protein C
LHICYFERRFFIMTDQVNFFDPQDDPNGQPLLIEEAAASTPKRRTFVYDGQYFSDPGAEYSTEDVLRFLAQDYPELESATRHSRTLPDGAEEITFVKVAGEKGAAAITADDLVTRLRQLNPAQLAAARLARQLLTGEPPTPEQIIARAGPIEAALQQLEPFTQKSQEALRRCLDLQPVPHPRVPLGF